MRKKILKSLSVFMIFALIFINISVKAEAATTGQDIVNYSKTFLGTPYVWGGTTPSGFDCSGFTQYVYKRFGIDITRTTYTQINVGTPVSRSELQLGDLVFTSAGHVGLYVGNNQIIHSPKTGDVVKISTIWSFYAARRILTQPVQTIEFRGYITENNTPYYSSSSNDDSLIKGYLNVGDVVGCYEKVGSWYYTTKGWIYDTRLREMPFACNFIVTEDNTPYYSSASNNDSLIKGYWKKGDQITIFYKEGSWYYTSVGYVYQTRVAPVFR